MAEDKEAFQKFFQAALEGGWGLLQHYMCRPMPRDRHMNMTGGGLGNVFGALQRPGIPLDLFSSVQVGGDSDEKDQDEENKENKEKKLCVNMINPTQQTVDQAISKLKRDQDNEPPKKKYKSDNRIKPSKKQRKHIPLLE